MSNVLGSAPRRRTYAGIVGVALVVTALGAGTVAAQDASPAPDAGGVQVMPVDPGNGSWQQGPMPGGPDGATWHSVTIGPDGKTYEQSGQGAFGGPGEPGGTGGVIQVGPDGSGGMTWGGFGGGLDFGSGTVIADGRGVVTVTAVDGATVSLKTDDGWTKDVDTTNVVITRDATTLAASDLVVGDTVHVVQTRNANGTYTITGLELVLPSVIGSVASVGTDSFTLNKMDGTTTTVHVTDSTTWRTPGSTATGLAALTVGDIAVAQGKLEADGSMDATSVMAAGMPMRIQGRMGDPGTMGGPGMRGGPGRPGGPVPSPAESPEASPATNG